jgi:hypothetical protein
MAKQTEMAEERKTTMRLVLQRRQVLVLPDGVDAEKIAAAAKALGVRVNGSGVDTSAWLPVGEFQGVSQTKAIEAYAGKPGSPDAKVGAFKAVPTSSWRGGELYEAPPAPLVERRALED